MWLRPLLSLNQVVDPMRQTATVMDLLTGVCGRLTLYTGRNLLLIPWQTLVRLLPYRIMVLTGNPGALLTLTEHAGLKGEHSHQLATRQWDVSWEARGPYRLVTLARVVETPGEDLAEPPQQTQDSSQCSTPKRGTTCSM